MADLLAGRTTFVIAHRLSTIRRAHLILLMEDGQVIERGTHQQLMHARGVYYDMVQRQSDEDGSLTFANPGVRVEPLPGVLSS
jgi:ABC-type multidrug transport system fused ATPase/permease subunit